MCILEATTVNVYRSQSPPNILRVLSRGTPNTEMHILKATKYTAVHSLQASQT